MRDMLGRGEALPPEAALKKILSALPEWFPETEELAIEDSPGRVVAADIPSPEDLPSFDRSTVDGYALRAADSYGASETLPVYLCLAGEVKMAEKPSLALGRGQAAKIPTGGMLPEGADSVVMLEHANEAGAGVLEIMKPCAPGQNVIKRGEDAGKGERLLTRGDTLRPQDVAALAGVGITRVRVFRKPAVSILVTGDEISPADEKELRPGFVRDMNSYCLAGLVQNCGGLPVREGIFRDDHELLKDALEKAISRSDMVLITGGSSVGAKDFTARLIAEAGSVLFHGVAMKPGKPAIGGIIAGKPVFGLPGHPAAVGVCFEVFVRPVLRRLAGARQTIWDMVGTVCARLLKDVSSDAGKDHYIRVALHLKEGELWAEPVLGPSGLIRTLVRADGAFLVPAGRAGAGRGEMVEVRLF